MVNTSGNRIKLDADYLIAGWKGGCGRLTEIRHSLRTLPTQMPLSGDSAIRGGDFPQLGIAASPNWP